jgi:hypothetical protein
MTTRLFCAYSTRGDKYVAMRPFTDCWPPWTFKQSNPPSLALTTAAGSSLLHTNTLPNGSQTQPSSNATPISTQQSTSRLRGAFYANFLSLSCTDCCIVRTSTDTESSQFWPQVIGQYQRTPLAEPIYCLANPRISLSPTSRSRTSQFVWR